jgi:hypothetical protein
MLPVNGAQVLRHKELDWLVQQLLSGVAEELLGLAIDQPDAATSVDHYDGVREHLHQRLEATGDIPIPAAR